MSRTIASMLMPRRGHLVSHLHLWPASAVRWPAARASGAQVPGDLLDSGLLPDQPLDVGLADPPFVETHGDGSAEHIRRRVMDTGLAPQEAVERWTRTPMDQPACLKNQLTHHADLQLEFAAG
jgi:hypothetical protein